MGFRYTQPHQLSKALGGVTVEYSEADERLAQAAYWYYVLGMDQAEVARKLQTGRSNVSRLLRAARERGLVTFQVNYPLSRELDLEHAVEQSSLGTNLRDCIVVKLPQGAEREDISKRLVGTAAARWLNEHTHVGPLRIGLFWGSAVRALVDSPALLPRPSHVFPLAGEWSNDPYRSSNDLVRDLAARLQGSYSYVHAPAAAKTAEDARAMTSDTQNRTVMDMAREADVCMVGIGGFGFGTSEEFLTYSRASREEMAEIKRLGARGQLAGRFFDDAGKELDLAIHRRLISCSLADIKEAGTVVALALGAEKRDAVLAAMKGALIDVLICDSELAAAIAGN